MIWESAIRLPRRVAQVERSLVQKVGLRSLRRKPRSQPKVSETARIEGLMASQAERFWRPFGVLKLRNHAKIRRYIWSVRYPGTRVRILDLLNRSTHRANDQHPGVHRHRCAQDPSSPCYVTSSSCLLACHRPPCTDRNRLSVLPLPTP